MAPVAAVQQIFPQQPIQSGWWRFAVALTLLGVISACSTHPVDTRAIASLAPLVLADRSVTVEEVSRRVPDADLLATDAPMREFVARYTEGAKVGRQRLISLHRAVTGAGILDLQYDPFADGTARQAFHRGTANCLAAASLFVALAREAGLDASYQWLDVRPQWSLKAERVMVGLHVNALVKVSGAQRYMVDIDPLPSREVAGTVELSDSDALALHHSNMAIDALAAGELERAWLYGVRALQLAPRMAHLWVNLGAIYRSAGQHREAEHSYLHALQLDPAEQSAMNNLVILYGVEDRAEERRYWAKRVEHYRQANPYYHAWLGDRAGQRGSWREALRNYDDALYLLPGDSRLLYARGLIYYQLDELDAAARDIKRAIDHATLRSDIKNYQQRLDDVRREQVAGL